MSAEDLFTARTVAEFTRIQGGRFALNLFVQIYEEPKLIFFSSPFSYPNALQNQLTSIIQSTNSGSDTQNRIFENPYQIGTARFCEMLEDPQFTKFSFIRDPIDRFCAAFNNVMSEHAPASDQKELLLKYLGHNSGELLLSKFAEIIAENTEARDLIPVFRPQRNIIAYDFVEFDFVGNSDIWQHDLQRFLSEYVGISDDKLTSLKKKPHPDEFMYEIDNSTQICLENAYLADYELLEELQF
ncbi:MAG: sulfotransferase family 2 domain-containing protein [Rhodobacteraceae bacterium]|nr:sulfotransferase family 2 domain-containing protein [Paracoccaceae bacterium]